jgi:ATP/maltotriose-dependent transcriptional regulator MalT
VPRDGLVSRLAQSAPCRLALVCAPAGWGKTVLFAQWRVCKEEHRPFAWVSLDASDEPVRFWSYVVAALRTIARRADPPLPLARLRAAGELVEVRAGELQFDRADADALLNGSLALGLGPGDVELLRRRTEGWPAGLQLAGLSLRERSDRSAFIRTLAGDDRQIGDYLHEVIEGAPRPMRDFLLRTSILERMCAPLCEAVTDSADATFLLSEAFRSNLFVVALDDRGRWFRYHHLLRDLLRRELLRAEPELVGELHARASAWHEARGTSTRRSSMPSPRSASTTPAT